MINSIECIEVFYVKAIGMAMPILEKSFIKNYPIYQLKYSFYDT